jgi:hypothetical protein
MDTLQTQSQLIVRRAVARPDTCSCADPIPTQRAERKGAALTICHRCGPRLPARLR